MTTMVDMRGIGKAYGEGAARVEALRGVELAVPTGQMLSVMGPSGSGKSTLLHILGLLDLPTRGTYLLNGEDVSRISALKAAQIRGRRIGFVFQGIHLLPRLSAVDNVALPMVYSRMARRETEERARAALERVGVWDLAHRYPTQVSGGQAQRIAIARAIAPGPDLLVADEPTGALDRKSGRQVLSLFQALHRELGLTIVIVTHDPDVAGHAERIVRMEDGRVIADETVAQRKIAGEEPAR